MDFTQVEEEEKPIMEPGLVVMVGSACENAEGVAELCLTPAKKVMFEQIDSSDNEEEEEEEEEEGWDGYDSFPEFPPGEVPDFLAFGGRKVQQGAAPTVRLYKHRSWSSNDSYREEAWLRRKQGSSEPRRSKSVTDEDVDELRGCIELGFRFDGEEDRSLSGTIPALDLYYAVNRQYVDCAPRSSASDCSGSPAGSPQSFFVPGDSPQQVKIRLRQWAQVVACSLRNSR